MSAPSTAYSAMSVPPVRSAQSTVKTNCPKANEIGSIERSFPRMSYQDLSRRLCADRRDPEMRSIAIRQPPPELRRVLHVIPSSLREQFTGLLAAPSDTQRARNRCPQSRQ